MEKVPQSRAGYMELTGAVKDADCEKVAVQGGVSKDRGCCNLYEPEHKSVTQFKCGACEYLSSPLKSVFGRRK